MNNLQAQNSDRIIELTESELTFVASWLNLHHPDLAAQGLRALADYQDMLAGR